VIRIFIGYDSNLPVLYNVLQHSILMRSSQPVCIHPVMLSQLHGVYTRDRDPFASTEFSFSRFLVPYLSGYEGWSLFIDNDMLVLDDIAKLWSLRDERYALMCTKHDHIPKEETKFLGAVQTKYEKKNWSSLMLFNNSRCKVLTPNYVNSASGLELHQFKWLPDDELIGAIPLRWNHLVGYSPANGEVSIAHFTHGGPYFPEYEHCEFSDEWHRERSEMLYCLQKIS
jgi:hypothetical protein